MKRLCERKSYAELSKTGKVMRSWGWAAVIAAAVVLVAVIVVAALRARYSTDDAIATETKLYMMYTIEQGDSLWSIAEEHVDYDHYDDIRDYVDEVVSINNLDNKNSITVGCNLVIPYYREDTDESSN